MADETQITMVGGLVEDPELRYSKTGIAVASMRIASTSRQFDKQEQKMVDKDTLYLRATAFKDMAENVAQTLHKGDRVIVTGRLKQNNYETKEGEKRTSYDIQIDDIGPSLKFAEAKVTKTYKNKKNNDSLNTQHSDGPPF